MSGNGLTMTPAEIFCAMQNSEHTKRAYRNDIRKWEQFLASKAYAETTETAVAFKDELQAIYAPATAQRVWCTVAAFYGWMKGKGMTDVTPFLGIKSPSRPSNEPPPVPSDEDVAKLLSACENGTSYGDRARLIVSLLLNGLRAQEVCDAKIEDVKFDDTTKQWILNVCGKGDKWRAVPLTSETQQSIFDYYLNREATDRSEHVVCGVNAALPVDVKTVWRTVKFFATKAGVKNMHPHALRHHYATRLVRAGVDVFTLQKLMGHARADTTQRYVGLDYSDLSKAIALDPMHEPSETHIELLSAFNMEWEDKDAAAI